MKTLLILLAAVLALLSPRASAQSYTYDEIGRLKQVRYASGASVIYTYDVRDNLISVTPFLLASSPTALDISITAFRTATLTWQHDGNGTGFVIQKRPAGSTEWVDIATVAAALRSIVLSNPTAAEFSLRIIANGTGPDSQSAPTAEIGFPNGAPVFVTTLVDENDSALGMGVGDSLREVIANARTGEVIQFAPVLNGGTITLTRGPLLISKRLTIDASPLPDKVTIDAGGASRIVLVQSPAPVTLRELTFANGSFLFGGAIRNDGTALTVRRCQFMNNQATDKGGAIYNVNGGNLTLNDGCIFQSNTAGMGGAVFNDTGASLSVDGATFFSNSSSLEGGAIFNQGAAFTVGYASFSANGASSGGAIFNRNSSGVIVNSTFAQNGSELNLGGGIANDGTGALIIRHCTVCANVGFGIANTSPATLTLENSIVASNYNTTDSYRDFIGSYTAIGKNLIRNTTSSTRLSGDAPITGDPKLGEFTSGAMPPLIGSTAIDAAVVTADTPSVDQQRSSRNFGAAPDLGAIESRLNANVDLLWLTTSAGLLTPSFDSTVYQYSTSIPDSVTTFAIRGAKVANNQTLQTRINGGSFTTLASKDASPNYPLNSGANTVEVKVTAANGTTTQSYLITVTRGSAPTANTGLASLTPATGTLSPAFSPAITSYALSVPVASSSTTLTAPAAQPGSTVKVRTNYGAWTAVPAGGLTPGLPLHPGDNMVEFSVTDAGGAITASYQVVVTREGDAAADASLAALTTSAGTIAFSPGTTYYRITVPTATPSITITATTAQPGSTLKINTVPITSGATSSPLSVSAGETEIPVEVIAPNGTTVRRYSILVIKPNAAALTWVSSPGALNSSEAAISADGRFAAYSSQATNLVPNDTNNFEDIFVFDRNTATIERISVSSAAVQGNGNSTFPTISADGRYVAFQSDASNLVSGDSNGQTDVFIHDRTTDTTERLSLRADGSQSSSSSDNPSISADGRFVAFKGSPSMMISGFSSAQTIICIRDRSDNSLAGVPVPYPVSPSNRFSINPAISADGKYVAFECNASLSGTGNTDFSHTEIYLYDVANRAVERITGTKTGLQANLNRSQRPSISADGRYTVFHSNMESLDFHDTNLKFDVFVFDRITRITKRVSTPDNGPEELNADSFNAAVSGDGSHVAFHSQRSQLVPGDTNGSTLDVYVKNLHTGVITLRSMSTTGAVPTGAATTPSLSHDGQSVAFTSEASNLLPSITTINRGAYVSAIAPLPPGGIFHLRQITSNLGPITPGLSSSPSSYSARVPAETSIAIVAPVTADPAATLSTRVGNGAYSPLPPDGLARLPLNFGTNAVQIRVTAADGIGTGIYTINVDRGSPDLLATNATLASLVPNSSTLSPIFQPATGDYTISVPNATTTMTFVPTVGQPGATVLVDGSPVVSGAASAPIALAEGVTNVQIDVTAPDGLTVFTYGVAVNRSLGDNSNLSNLTVSSGSLSPVFSSGTLQYTANVASNVSGIMLTPTAVLTGAFITMDGASVDSGQPSPAFPLEIGSNLIFITVTTGTTTNYILNVNRPDPTGAVVRLDALAVTEPNNTALEFWGTQLATGTPTYLTNQTPLGKPAVHFDGTDHMGDNIFVPAAAAAQDFIIAAVIKPDSTGAYHRIIDDDAQTSPMLLVQPGFQYEMNFGANSTPVGSTGTSGWDIILVDSRLNQIYLNSPTANASGRDATTYGTTRAFDFFHRDGAQTFRGKVAELRIYNDRAAISGGFAGLHRELYNKWIGTPYTLWAAANLPAGQDTTFDGDANGNGLTNGVEYVFGLDAPGFTNPRAIPAPGIIPPDVNLYLDRSASLTSDSWATIVRWVDGNPPVLTGGAVLAGGEIRDDSNPTRAFYRYRVVLLN